MLVDDILKSGSCQVPSLQYLAVQTYLDFLEEACVGYIRLCSMRSRLLESIRRNVIQGLKDHLARWLSGRGNSSLRHLMIGIIMNKPESGDYDKMSRRYPSLKFTNQYDDRQVDWESLNEWIKETLAREDAEKFGSGIEKSIAKRWDTITESGRGCLSICCTGAFTAEAMLCVIANEDLENLDFLDRNRFGFSGISDKERPFHDLVSVKYIYIEHVF